jgi:hypothetical protein
MDRNPDADSGICERRAVRSFLPPDLRQATIVPSESQKELSAGPAVGQPPAIGRPDGALLHDEHGVCRLDAVADGLPVEASPVEEAQVDEFGVDARLLDRLWACQVIVLENYPDAADVTRG